MNRKRILEEELELDPGLKYMLSSVTVKTASKGFKSLSEISCTCPVHSSSAIPSWFLLALEDGAVWLPSPEST